MDFKVLCTSASENVFCCLIIVAFFFPNAMSDWRVFAVAFKALIFRSDYLADLETSSVVDANFLLA